MIPNMKARTKEVSQSTSFVEWKMKFQAKVTANATTRVRAKINMKDLAIFPKSTSRSFLRGTKIA